MAHEPDVNLESDDAPYPPLWLTRLYAFGGSLVTVPLIAFWWGSWENRSEELEDRYVLPGWLFLGALVTAWVAYALTTQGNFNHATGTFVLSVGLVVASLLVAFA